MASCSRPVWGTSREWAVRLTVAATLGVFFGVIGPFGTYARPLALRVASWTLGFALGVSLFTVTVRAARRWAPRLDLPVWFAAGASVALTSAPFSAVLGLLFAPRYWLGGGWPAWLELYGNCLVIAVPLTAAAVAYPRLTGAPAVPQGASGDPPATASKDAASVPLSALVAGPTGRDLLDRLPPRLGRELVALQMEDHYVRAHTRRGSDLLLLSMGQALEVLPPMEGLRVHRSWWVARNAVEGQTWEGRNLRLRLAGGLEAPVARAQVAALRAAGWLAATSGEDQRLGSAS